VLTGYTVSLIAVCPLWPVLCVDTLSSTPSFCLQSAMHSGPVSFSTILCPISCACLSVWQLPLLGQPSAVFVLLYPLCDVTRSMPADVTLFSLAISLSTCP
jgi:hypothetical protein